MRYATTTAMALATMMTALLATAALAAAPSLTPEQERLGRDSLTRMLAGLATAAPEDRRLVELLQQDGPFFDSFCRFKATTGPEAAESFAEGCEARGLWAMTKTLAADLWREGRRTEPLARTWLRALRKLGRSEQAASVAEAALSSLPFSRGLWLERRAGLDAEATAASTGAATCTDDRGFADAARRERCMRRLEALARGLSRHDAAAGAAGPLQVTPATCATAEDTLSAEALTPPWHERLDCPVTSAWDERGRVTCSCPKHGTQGTASASPRGAALKAEQVGPGVLERALALDDPALRLTAAHAILDRGAKVDAAREQLLATALAKASDTRESGELLAALATWLRFRSPATPELRAALGDSAKKAVGPVHAPAALCLAWLSPAELPRLDPADLPVLLAGWLATDGPAWDVRDLVLRAVRAQPELVPALEQVAAGNGPAAAEARVVKSLASRGLRR